MIKALRRFLGLGEPRMTLERNLEAAAGGRRWESARTLDNINAAIFAGARTAARRGAHYARNNPWIANGVSALASNIVGAGIKPQSQHPDPRARDRLHRLWEDWTDHADAAGLTDFYGLQALAARAMVESGECFVRLRPQPEASGPVPLQLELMDAEQIPIDLHRDLASGVRIRGGIELDAANRRRAFHAYKARPGDGPLSLDTVRLPAEDVAHLFAPLAPGQIRGVTWLAPILLRLHELDGMEDAALVRAKVQALFAAFIVDPDGSAGGFAEDGKTANGLTEVGLEPGTAYTLPPGRNIQFSAPPTGGSDYDTFTKNHLRAIAAGIGVTYEQLTGDLSGVTYSSIRAGLIEFRRRVEQIQHGVLVYQLCRPVWERFVRMAVLSGALPAPDFADNPSAWLRATWRTPAWDWVDPQKDVQAEIAAIGACLKSRSQAIGERGYDAEQVDAEIAADQARAKRLGMATEEATSA